MTQDFWTFIADNAAIDPLKLRLKYGGKVVDGFDIDFAITQIECRKKFGKKIAETLKEHPHWLFPSMLAGEQCTSDSLATFHSTLINEGERVADLTAGLGIDCLHLSQKAAAITAVEIDTKKAECLRLNLGDLGVNVVKDDCRDFLDNCDASEFDTLFIDPARRDSTGGRLYSVADCSPDVTEMLALMQRVASKLIIKLSPMLDITHTAAQLPGVTKIISLGTPTECKELIAVVDLRGTSSDDYIIQPVVIGTDGDIATFVFSPAQEQAAQPAIALPKDGEYIYEPSPTIMKAAPWGILTQRYPISMLHPNTHIFVSDLRIENFPGRMSSIEEILPFSSSTIKEIGRRKLHCEVAVRNFDFSAEQLAKRLKVKPGSDIRIIGATLADSKKYLIICRR